MQKVTSSRYWPLARSPIAFVGILVLGLDEARGTQPSLELYRGTLGNSRVGILDSPPEAPFRDIRPPPHSNGLAEDAQPSPHLNNLAKDQSGGMPEPGVVAPTPLPHVPFTDNNKVVDPVGVTNPQAGLVFNRNTDPGLTSASLQRPSVKVGNLNFRRFVNGAIVWAIWVALALLVGIFYKPSTPALDEDCHRSGNEAVQELESGHCNCFEDPASLTCAVLCPMLRFADTVSQAGLGKFWISFILYSFLAFVNLFHNGDVWWGLFTCAGIVYYRQRLRAKIRAQHHDAGTCCFDFLFSLICPCCALAQDARVVQIARSSGCEGFSKEGSV